MEHARRVRVDRVVEEEADPPRHALVGEQAPGTDVGVAPLPEGRELEVRQARQPVGERAARVAHDLGRRRVAIDDGVLGHRTRREEPPLRAVGEPLMIVCRDERHQRRTGHGRRRGGQPGAAVALGDEALERRGAIEGVVAAAREVGALEVVANVGRLARVLEHGERASQREQRARERRVARRGLGRGHGGLEPARELRETDVVVLRDPPFGRGQPREVEVRARRERPEGAVVDQRPDGVRERRAVARAAEARAPDGVVKEVLAPLGRRPGDHRAGDHPGQRRGRAVVSRAVAVRRVERAEPAAERARLGVREIRLPQPERLEEAQRATQALGQHLVQGRRHDRAFGQARVRRRRIVGTGRSRRVHERDDDGRHRHEAGERARRFVAVVTVWILQRGLPSTTAPEADRAGATRRASRA